MSLTADMILAVLAFEAIQELKITNTTLTSSDFESITSAVMDKISVMNRDGDKNYFPEEDDELRNFFLGTYITYCICQFLYTYFTDQAFSAVKLKAQKLATQWGDGDTLAAFWKLSLLDYYVTHSVRVLSSFF